ncbi:MAG: hypothetical protein ACLTBV_18750 [Enterocloster bolteae]
MVAHTIYAIIWEDTIRNITPVMIMNWQIAWQEQAMGTMRMQWNCTQYACKIGGRYVGGKFMRRMA